MCWDQPSVSNWAIGGMRGRASTPRRRRTARQYATSVALAYMKRFHRMVKESNPEATCHFNSRPLSNLAEEIAVPDAGGDRGPADRRLGLHVLPEERALRPHFAGRTWA